MHGHYDSNLTCRGLKQVRALANRFEQFPVAACYSSDLMRAQNTAQGVCVPNGLSLGLEPAFREAAVGVWEDRSFGSLRRFDRDKMEQFFRDPVHWSVEGGETYDTYTGRFLTALDRLAQLHQGEHIAVVTHSIVMKAVLQVLFPQLAIPHCGNTSVTRLEWEAGEYRLVMLNDLSHLSEALRCAPRLPQQELIWFRDGWTELPLHAPKTGLAYTVMQEDTPIGLVCLDVQPPEGKLCFFGLLPQWRGAGLGIHLVGKAISVLRSSGIQRMICCGETCAEAAALWKKLPFEEKGSGEWILELEPRSQAF